MLALVGYAFQAVLVLVGGLVDLVEGFFFFEGFAIVDDGDGLLRRFETPFVAIGEVWFEAFCSAHFVDICSFAARSRTVADLVEGFSFVVIGKGLLRWFETPFVDISEVWLEAFCFSHFVDIFEGFSFVEVGVDVMPCYSEGKK